MAGPIATEVIEGVRAGMASGEHVVPVRPTEPVPIMPAPGAPPTQTVPAPGSEGGISGPPLRVTAANIAKPYSAAWWFEKGGTTGIVCFAMLGLLWAMNSSQKESQKALIDNMQTSEKNRSEENRRMIDGVLRTQTELTTEIRQVGRTLEKLDSRMERLFQKGGFSGTPKDHPEPTTVATKKDG